MNLEPYVLVQCIPVDIGFVLTRCQEDAGHVLHTVHCVCIEVYVRSTVVVYDVWCMVYGV